ncbi:MAG TPA: IS200/IS605 family transposase [Candidatus Kapabacteria bacterium]|nr:IS200/IS605 family transposase [Candidatus Kapabacteria bacterium]
MSHSYISTHIHIVFATKNRNPCLSLEIRNRLWQYLGGLCKERNIEPISIGGYIDHCHALISLPSTTSVAMAVKYLKGASSRWLSETFPELMDFSWQKGYGAFSVSVSGIERTIQYINNQEQHHQRQSFENEYIEFLNLHHLAFDEDSLWAEQNTSEGQNDI